MYLPPPSPRVAAWTRARTSHTTTQSPHWPLRPFSQRTKTQGTKPWKEGQAQQGKHLLLIVIDCIIKMMFFFSWGGPKCWGGAEGCLLKTALCHQVMRRKHSCRVEWPNIEIASGTTPSASSSVCTMRREMQWGLSHVHTIRAGLGILYRNMNARVENVDLRRTRKT